MKQVIFLAIAFATLAVVACKNEQTVPAEEAERQRDSLQAIIDEKNGELNEFMGAFTEIQDGIKQMAEAEGRVTVANGDPEKGNNKVQIRENMQFLNEALNTQRERIAQLQKKLQGSSLNVEKMQKALNNLQAQLDEQTARIQELQVQLSERDETIAKQSETISRQDQTINQLGQENEQKSKTVAAQDEALHEAYYVFGTKSELKTQHVIDGGEVLTTGKFNKDYFTKVDIRTTKEIRLYSKNAKMLTTHPNGSYALAKDAKGEYVLKISNAEKFWSLSKYLVIQVK